VQKAPGLNFPFITLEPIGYSSLPCRRSLLFAGYRAGTGRIVTVQNSPAGAVPPI
jgi:hypothetical protein